MKIFLPLFFFAAASSAIADPRYVTLEVSGARGTNTLTVAPYEVAELVSFPVVSIPRTIWFKRDGAWLLYQDERPLVLAGPASIELRGNGGIATFKLLPDSYPPDRSILIAPGTGGAAISLECSTNLVDWSSATNGVYANPPVAKFFRIRADRIP